MLVPAVNIGSYLGWILIILGLMINFLGLAWLGVIIFSGSQGGSPCDEAQRKEMREEIEQAMADLPDRQQAAVVLFEIEGCSIKQIAEAMACSEGAVKFNIHEARKKLKRRLSHLMQSMHRKSDAPPAKQRITKTANS